MIVRLGVLERLYAPEIKRWKNWWDYGRFKGVKWVPRPIGAEGQADIGKAFRVASEVKVSRKRRKRPKWGWPVPVDVFHQRIREIRDSTKGSLGKRVG